MASVSFNHRLSVREEWTRARLVVAEGIPDGWDDLVEGAPPTVSERWIGISPRLPGYRTFALVHDGRPLVAVGGGVAEGVLENTRLDPWHILSGRSVGHGLVPDGPHPWRGLEPADVFPCGVFMFPHYELLPVGPAAAAPAAGAALVRALLDWAADERLRSVSFLYLRPEAQPLVDALRDEGGEVVDLIARCDLEVAWDDFEGYLGSLSLQNRGNARRELRKLAARGVEIGSRGIREHEPELVELRCKLAAKYDGRPDAGKEAAVLERFRASFAPEELTLFTAERGGKLLCFSLFVRDGTHWTAYSGAADYDDPASRFAYFATHFYRPLGLAASLGIRTVGYGLGSVEAKRRRGCRLTPLLAAGRLIS